MAKIVIKNVRIAFANGLWKPYADPSNANAEPKFSCAFLLPKDHPQLPEIVKVMKAVAAEKWGAKAEATYTELKAANKVMLHDGDTKASYDGYAGNLFISANNRSRPVVLDQQKNPLTQADGKPYSGCYVNVSLDLWPQDNKYGKRINATLLAVQFSHDGEAFSGGESFEDGDFETIEEAAGEAGGDLF